MSIVSTVLTAFLARGKQARQVGCVVWVCCVLWQMYADNACVQLRGFLVLSTADQRFALRSAVVVRVVGDG